MSTYLLDLAGLRIAQENGTELTAASTINFGDGLTASYDAATRSILVENSGGGGASLADYKDSVRAATTGNITLSGPQTIDGVSVIAGQRVLVKNQGVGSENGIYLCAAGAWTRATDFDSGTDVTSLALIPVEEGTINAGKFFKLTTTGTITLGATSLVFEETIATGTAADFLIHNGVKWVGAKTATQNALATAHTAGLTLDNATAATAIATHQASPEFVVSGNWWDLTGTPQSREITWGIGARLHGTDVPGLTIYGTAGATYTGQLVHFGYAQQDAKVVAVFGESAAVEHGTLRGPTGFDIWSRNVAGTGDVRMIRSATAGGLDGLFIGSNTALQGATIVRIRATNPASNGEITLDSPGTQNAAVAAKWAVTTLGFNAVTRVAADATNGRLEDGSGNTVASWDTNWLLVPRAAIAAGTTVGLTLANATAATGGATLQASPALALSGAYWTGAASAAMEWKLQARLSDDSLPELSAFLDARKAFGFQVAAGSVPEFIFYDDDSSTRIGSIYGDTDPYTINVDAARVRLLSGGTARVVVNATGLGFFAATPVAQPADLVAITDNTAGTASRTLAALPDPADTPASADALRDDLVTNVLPVLRNWAASLADFDNDLRTGVIRPLGLSA